MTRRIIELSPKEVLALAIHVERTNGNRLRQFAGSLESYDEQAAKKFQELAAEEDRHEEWLMEKFKRRYEGQVPAVNPSEVEGVVKDMQWGNPSQQIFGSLRAENAYRFALDAEKKAREFYLQAVQATGDKSLAVLFRMLAAMEKDHVSWLEDRLQGVTQKNGKPGGEG